MQPLTRREEIEDRKRIRSPEMMMMMMMMMILHLSSCGNLQRDPIRHFHTAALGQYIAHGVPLGSY